MSKNPGSALIRLAVSALRADGVYVRKSVSEVGTFFGTRTDSRVKYCQAVPERTQDQGEARKASFSTESTATNAIPALTAIST